MSRRIQDHHAILQNLCVIPYMNPANRRTYCIVIQSVLGSANLIWLPHSLHSINNSRMPLLRIYIRCSIEKHIFHSIILSCTMSLIPCLILPISTRYRLLVWKAFSEAVKRRIKLSAMGTKQRNGFRHRDGLGLLIRRRECAR